MAIDKGIEDTVMRLIHWGTARAGVVIVVPVLGVGAFWANIAYMVTRIAKVRGVDLSPSVLKGFLAGLGGVVAASTATMLIPFPLMQIPIAVGTAYGIGKAADAWIKDGMPEDMSTYRSTFKSARDFAKKNSGQFKDGREPK